jgi:heptosyltransferase-2
MNMKNILVIRFSSLGDVVLTTPVYPNLKSEWPNARITVLTKKSFQSVFEGNPHVDRVWTFDSDSEGYFSIAKRVHEEKFDLIVDLQNNLKSYFLRVIAGPPLAVPVDKVSMARWKLLLLKWASPVLEGSVRERNLDTLRRINVGRAFEETQLFPQNAEDVLKKLNIPVGRRLIGIAPGARHATKRWPVEKFAEAANRLGAFPDTTLLLLGDKSDEAVGKAVQGKLVVDHRNIVGRTNLSELIAVTSRLSFLLTNDSGLLHVGEALGVRLVSIFGPTVRAFGFAPYRSTSRVVEVSLPCRPCSRHGDEACPLRHHNCMMDVDVSAVLFAASSVLDHVNFEPESCEGEHA